MKKRNYSMLNNLIDDALMVGETEWSEDKMNFMNDIADLELKIAEAQAKLDTATAAREMAQATKVTGIANAIGTIGAAVATAMGEVAKTRLQTNAVLEMHNLEKVGGMHETHTALKASETLISVLK